MPDLNDFHAFNSTSGASSGGNGEKKGSGGFGCGGWAVIIATALLLILFISNGASFDAVDTLLGLGLIAFFVARAIFR